MSKEDPRDFVDLDIGWSQFVANQTWGDGISIAQDHARGKVDSIEVVRRKLATSASGNLTRAATIVAETGAKRMSTEDYSEFERRTTRATALAGLDERLESLQRRYQARVVSEPRVYGEDSPNSYYRDLQATVEHQLQEPRAQQAIANLSRYGDELAYEARQRSPEGQRVLRCVAEYERQANPDYHKTAVRQHTREICETRGLTTGGGMTASASGGGAASFVTPAFLIDKFAPFKGIHRSFADWCDTAPLPEWGMRVYLSSFTSAPGMGTHTEGASVTETDPTTGLQGAPVIEISGQLTLSQALYDRGYLGGPQGGGFDIAVNKQLQTTLNQNLDTYVIGQAIAGTTPITGAATWGFGTWYQDLALGREQLTDTAGTRLRPTTFFSSSDFYSYVTRQLDSSNRPVVSPQFAPALPIQTAGDSVNQKWSRFTGTILPGSVLWIEDDNIPASSGKNQLLVSAPDEAMVLCEGEPIVSVFQETDAVNLETILNLRKYCVAIPRFPAGTANIVGAGYPTTLI